MQILLAKLQLGRILTEGERYALILRAIQATGAESMLDEAVDGIDAYKSYVSPPTAGWPSVEVFLAYERILREESAMDLQDILIKAVLIMGEGLPQPLPIRWMLVDEFQDTDEIHYERVKLRTASGTESTVVGDDDQSLYSWRNAMG